MTKTKKTAVKKSETSYELFNEKDWLEYYLKNENGTWVSYKADSDNYYMIDRSNYRTHKSLEIALQNYKVMEALY